MKQSFFSRPIEFSFKDLLALVFTAFFFYSGYRAFTSGQAMELVKTLVPLIGIILGGYFGQEAIQLWRQHRDLSKENEVRVNANRGGEI